MNDGIKKLINLDFPQLTREQSEHLQGVYGLMLLGVIVTGISAAGGIFAANSGILSGSALGLIGLIGTIVSAIMLQSERATNISGSSAKGSTTHEIAYFGGLSASMGFSLVGILIYTLYINAQILVTAIMATIAVFVALTLSAMFATRRSYFWMASIAGTLLTYMFFGSLVNIFIPSQLVHNALTYVGLIVTVMYTLIDTQVVAESIRGGNRNTVVRKMVRDISLVATRHANIYGFRQSVRPSFDHSFGPRSEFRETVVTKKTQKLGALIRRRTRLNPSRQVQFHSKPVELILKLWSYLCDTFGNERTLTQLESVSKLSNAFIQ